MKEMLSYYSESIEIDEYEVGIRKSGNSFSSVFPDAKKKVNFF